MKKFKFRLETVLKVRQRHEEEKKRVVGGLLQEIHEQQYQAVTLSKSLLAEGERLKASYAAGQVDMNWVGHYCRYAHYIHHAIADRVEKVGRIQQNLNQARQALMVAAQQTRILDKLKEKQLDRYEARGHQLEAREQDELGTQGHIRQWLQNHEVASGVVVEG